MDDHPAFAEAVRSLLTADDRIDVVGVARNGEEALELAASLEPNLVLMDLDMPIMNGVEATRVLAQQHGLRVLLLTGSDSASDIVLARRAGASGLIRKGADSADVVASVFAIASKSDA